MHKVTIIPRGRALGVTMQLPEQDRYAYDREYLLNRIAVLFGGRIAEELFMNQMTTGASNDFERATQMARDMVTRYGMSDLLGPMVYAENEGEVFLGRSITKTTNMSEETMRKVDAEIRRIIDEQYALARKLLEDNRDKVEAMAKALLELGDDRRRADRRHHRWQTAAAAEVDWFDAAGWRQTGRRYRGRRATRLSPSGWLDVVLTPVTSAAGVLLSCAQSCRCTPWPNGGFGDGCSAAETGRIEH